MQSKDKTKKRIKEMKFPRNQERKNSAICMRNVKGREKIDDSERKVYIK